MISDRILTASLLVLLQACTLEYKCIAVASANISCQNKFCLQKLAAREGKLGLGVLAFYSCAVFPLNALHAWTFNSFAHAPLRT
jgi:hypothetical protein